VHTARLLKMMAVGGAAALVLAACGGGSDSGSGDSGGVPDVPTYQGPVGDGEGALNILAWPGYAENGSTDPSANWVGPFEEATGCKVNVKTFGTSDEAVKLMQGGGWDVVSASGDASLRLIYGGNVQPINMDLVPNYADIFPDLKMKSHNSVNGVAYGVPHGRGANLLVWNKEKVGETVDSWSVMFEPDSPAAGGVGPYDSPIYIADAAVYLIDWDKGRIESSPGEWCGRVLDRLQRSLLKECKNMPRASIEAGMIQLREAHDRELAA